LLSYPTREEGSSHIFKLYKMHTFNTRVISRPSSTSRKTALRQTSSQQNDSNGQLSVSIAEGTDNYEHLLLAEFFEKERPFLKQGYTLIHMTRDLGIPRHVLSRMINQQYGMNFNALINHFRVQFLKNIPAIEPKWNLFTMEALGKKAGFNSRNTLIKAFKKCTGESPSSYFSRLISADPGKRNTFDYDFSKTEMRN